MRVRVRMRMPPPTVHMHTDMLVSTARVLMATSRFEWAREKSVGPPSSRRSSTQNLSMRPSCSRSPSMCHEPPANGSHREAQSSSVSPAARVQPLARAPAASMMMCCHTRPRDGHTQWRAHGRGAGARGGRRWRRRRRCTCGARACACVRRRWSELARCMRTCALSRTGGPEPTSPSSLAGERRRGSRPAACQV